MKNIKSCAKQLLFQIRKLSPREAEWTYRKVLRFLPNPDLWTPTWLSKSVSIANLTLNDSGKTLFQALCSHVLWILNVSRFQTADAIEPCLSVLISAVKTWGGRWLASISQAASGCLSISTSLEIPLWLRLEGVPVLTSRRCVSTQPPWSAISFSLLPVKNGCLLIEAAIMLVMSNWARRQDDSLYCFAPSASAFLLHADLPFLSLKPWPIGRETSSSVSPVAWLHQNGTPKMPVKRINCKNGKVIVFWEWLFFFN